MKTANITNERLELNTYLAVCLETDPAEPLKDASEAFPRVPAPVRSMGCCRGCVHAEPKLAALGCSWERFLIFFF